MDWFERLTGFRERDYEQTHRRLRVRDGCLVGAGGKAWSMGRLETPSLAELRQRAAPLLHGRGRTRVSCLTADVRALHADDASAGALFQVASQFNLLEMIGPDVTPEHGVARYESDRTQGPACAMAAGAGTIFRNYLVPLGDERGQRARRQIDCLADVGHALASHAGEPPWQMRNGYAMCTLAGLQAIDERLRHADDTALDALRARLRIGLHWNVDVTDREEPGHRVSQAYGSALPVAYSRLPAPLWARFATLVLEASYEATLLAAAIGREASGADRVYLTCLGGGAFGNEMAWIAAAMGRAIRGAGSAGLDIRLVSYRYPVPALQQIAEQFA